jgi:uncharacterized membrane protein YdjX (TVP38/TMEM64 family)
MRVGPVFRGLGQLGPLAMAATLLPPLGTAVLIGTIHQSSTWLRTNDVLGLVVFVTAFAVCGGFALLPTYTPALVGGWAFGLATGLAATLAGFAGAATIGFAMARRLSGNRLVDVLGRHPRGLAIHDAFVRSGFLKAVAVVALVRLPPNSPFALSTVVLAASRVGLAPFLLGTVVGIAPRALAAVVVGAGLARLDLSHPERTGHLLLGIATTVAAVAALGWMAGHAIRRMGLAAPVSEPADDVRA